MDNVDDSFGIRGDILWYNLRICLSGLDLRIASVEGLNLPKGSSHYYSDSGGPDLARLLKPLAYPRAAALGRFKRREFLLRAIRYKQD